MLNSTYEQPLPASLLDYAASGYYASGTAVPGGHHIYPEMAAAGLWTTPTDLARFLIELQLSLRGESNRVLSRQNAELLLTEVERDYALGFDLWVHGGEPYFGHGGANDGFRGRMVAHLTAGYGVVILTNSDNGSELSDAVLRLIGQREGWPGY
jgi:CubicO group peptidase (beta-lactamase class C family)